MRREKHERDPEMASDRELILKGSEQAESVTVFTRRLKTLLEEGLRPCWIRGEVSNLRIQSSGHLYFSLKDAGAQLSAVQFRGDAARSTVRLRDGLQVLALGEVSVYEPRGQYQLVVRSLLEDGVGRLQREFEALKARLMAEGLFDSARKRPLPSLPLRVGFITSPTGAAVQDFLRILQRRAWTGHCLVLPAKVQGEGAAKEMATMLTWAQELRLGPDGGPLAPEGKASEKMPPRFFELLVIGRGGGSLEDLWAFNEEVLVRAVAACPLPILSAVGHEIDFTLCDFAADVRAETPSAAAERISSSALDLRGRALEAARSLERLQTQCLRNLRSQVEPLKARLRRLTPASQLERGYQRLDELQARLVRGFERGVGAKRRLLTEIARRLERVSPEYRVQQESQRLLALYKRLQAASPQSVLNRGFTLLTDVDGRPLVRRSELGPGARVRARFCDGEACLRAEGEERDV